jgi:hypothetical protein
MRSGHAAETAQAPLHRPQQVRSGLGEHERAGADLGVPEDPGEHVGPPEVAEPHRDPSRRLPQVSLGDVPGQVQRSLVDPGFPKQRPDLSQVLVQKDLPPV